MVSGRAARARIALAASMASFLAFVLTASLAMHERAVWGADEGLFDDLVAHDHGAVGTLAHLFSHLGEPLPQIVLAAVAVAIGVRRGARLPALAAAAIVVGADLTTELLKKALVDHRLGMEGLLYPAGEHTFPSGHTTTMTALTISFWLVVPRRSRPSVAIVGGVLTVLVGGSMVILHQHWPSDAVGGVFVGSTWGFAAIAALEAWPLRERSARGQASLPLRR